MDSPASAATTRRARRGHDMSTSCASCVSGGRVRISRRPGDGRQIRREVVPGGGISGGDPELSWRTARGSSRARLVQADALGAIEEQRDPPRLYDRRFSLAWQPLAAPRPSPAGIHAGAATGTVATGTGTAPRPDRSAGRADAPTHGKPGPAYGAIRGRRGFRSRSITTETGAREHPTEAAARVGLFEPVAVQAERVQDRHQQRTQERIPAIRHPDDRAAARAQYAVQLRDSRPPSSSKCSTVPIE